MVLVVAAMLVSLLLDSGVQELRTARGELAAARAGAAAESALADLLAGPPDSGFAGLARGAAIQSVTAAGADTVRLTLQSLGGALARVVIRSRSWSGGIRADAGVLAYLIVTPGPNPPGSARFTRLPGWWWAAFP
jgi:hypothetical protein